MGSFNVTDALTRKNIRPSQKCKVIFLVENQLDNFTSVCHTHMPLLDHAFSCTYNDYGQFVFDSSEESRLELLRVIILQHLIEFEEGENEYHDIPVLKETFDVNKIFDYIIENRLFVERSFTDKSNPTHLTKKNLKVSYAAIDSEFYEYMLDNGKYEFFNSEPVSIREYTNSSLVTTKEMLCDIEYHLSKLESIATFLLRLLVIDRDSIDPAIFLRCMTVDKENITDSNVDDFKQLLEQLPDTVVPIGESFRKGFYCYSDFITKSAEFHSINLNEQRLLLNLLDWLGNYSNYTLTPSRYASESLNYDRLSNLINHWGLL